MKGLKKLGLASALALLAVSGVTGTASAVTIDPASTAVTLLSTHWSLSLSGGGTATCTSSTINGTTPNMGGVTWVTIPVTLVYTGCSYAGIAANVTPVAACNSSAKPIMHFMSTGASTAVSLVTLPAACSIDISIPLTGCTVTVTGGQTIGNGTSGTGGIAWANGSPKSSATLNAATVGSIDSNGVGAGCPSAGAHTAAMSGTYTVSSATNMTITP